MQPKVSVIVPIYNVEKYIERCVRSLMEQTLDDIEYLFINDCTPDASINILQRIAQEYPVRQKQIRIIQMSENSGQAAVRKQGIMLSTGQYIIHCDSDDWVDKDAYRILYEKANEENADIVFCDFYQSDGVNHKIKMRHFPNFERRKLLGNVVKNVYWTMWGAMIKRSVFTENAILYPKDNNGEDMALMFQCIYYGIFFSHVSQPLYYYFHNNNSITYQSGIKASERRANQVYNNVVLIQRFLSMNKCYNQYNDEMLLLKIWSKFKYSYTLFGQDKNKELLFKNTFPEISLTQVLFCRFIPIKVKIKYSIYNCRLNILLYRFFRIKI